MRRLGAAQDGSLRVKEKVYTCTIGSYTANGGLIYSLFLIAKLASKTVTIETTQGKGGRDQLENFLLLGAITKREPRRK